MDDLLYNPHVQQALKQGYSLQEVKQFAIDDYNMKVDHGMPEDEAREYLKRTYGLATGSSVEDADRSQYLTELLFMPVEGEQVAKQATSAAKEEKAGVVGTTTVATPTNAADSVSPRAPENNFDTLLAGFEHSVLGLLLRQEAPSIQPPQPDDLLGQFVFSSSQLLGDLPAIVAGTVGGSIAGSAGGPVGTVAGGAMGGAALPAMARQALIDSYRNGESTEPLSWLERTARVCEAGGKAGIAGLAGGAAGAKLTPLMANFASKTALDKLSTFVGVTVGEAGTAATSSALLEGRLPSASDFITNGLMIAGTRYAGRNIDALTQAYAEMGLHPNTIRRQLVADPVFSSKFLVDASSPKAPRVREVYGIDTAGQPSYSDKVSQATMASSRDRWLFLSREYADAEVSKRADTIDAEAVKTYERSKIKWERATQNADKAQKAFNKKMAEVTSQVRKDYFPDAPREDDAFMSWLETQPKDQQARYYDALDYQTITSGAADLEAQSFRAYEEALQANNDMQQAYRSTPQGASSTPLREVRAYNIPNTAPVIRITNGASAAANMLAERFFATSAGQKYDDLVRLFQRGTSVARSAASQRLIDEAPNDFLAFIRGSQWTIDEIKVLVGPEAAKRISLAEPGERLGILKGAKLSEDPGTLYSIAWAGLMREDRFLPMRAELVTPTRPAKTVQASKAMETAKAALSFKPEESTRSLSDRAREAYSALIDRVTALTKGTPAGQYTKSYILARLFPASTTRAEYFISRGTFQHEGLKDTGASLAEVLKDVPDLQKLSAYALATRTAALLKQGKPGLLDRATAEALTKELESDTVYAKALKDLQAYNLRVLKFGHEAGIISDKQLAELSQPSQQYVPLTRVLGSVEADLISSIELDALASRAATDKKALAEWRKRMRESGARAELVAIDPIESSIGATYLMVKAADMNRVRKEIAKDWAIADAVPRTESDGELGSVAGFGDVLHRITYMENGEKKSAYVQKDIYNAALALDAQSAKMFTKLMHIINAPSRTLRAGAVLDPTFIVRNSLLRDQIGAMIQSRNGYTFGLDMLRGFGAILNDRTGGKLFKNFDGLYAEWMKAGGMNASLVAADRHRMRESLNNIVGHKVRNVVSDPAGAVWDVMGLINPFSRVLTTLRGLSEAADSSTRLGEYRKARAAGDDPILAAFQSREVSLDFARAGVLGRAWNSVTAFFNASIQGLDKSLRLARENPLGFVSAHIGSVIIPTLLFTIAEQDIIATSPDSEGAMTAKQLPAWQKAAFWRLYVGDDYKYCLRIPKPHGIAAMMAAPIEAFFSWAYAQGETSFMQELVDAGFAETTVSTFVPPLMPTALSPVVETTTNYNFFTKNKIISGALESLSPELQYQAGTTGLAKLVARGLMQIDNRLGLPIPDRVRSPVIIDHIVRGYLGTLGANMMQAADYAYDIFGDRKRPTADWADVPFVKAFFVKYPSLSAKSIEKFNSEYNEVQRRYNDVKRLLDMGNAEATAQAEGLLLEGGVANLSSLKQAMGKMSKMITLIHFSDQFTPDEKAQNIENITLQMIQVADHGLEVIKEIKNARTK